jgi:tuftelin-interacting protein 11
MAQNDEDEDMDLDTGEENALDDEEEQKPTRGGIGSSRSGIVSGRTGFGMGFSREGASEESGHNESEPTPGPGGRGGIGSMSRLAGIGARKAPAFAASSSTPSSDKWVGDGDEPIPTRGGLGVSGRSKLSVTEANSVTSSPGLGISSPSFNSGTPAPQQAGMPTSFGSRTQRAFVRNAQPATPGVAPVQLSYEEKAHFAKIAGGFGARMMAKMGWEVVS